MALTEVLAQGGLNLADYEVGMTFLNNTDHSVTATITDKQVIGDILHYKLSIVPNLYNAQPRWLSEYGILLDYTPQSSARGAKRAKRPAARPKIFG